MPVHLAEIGGELIAQKDSFLCAAKGVAIGIAFQKKIGVGLFGGEGFIMQRLSGRRLALPARRRHALRADLQPGRGAAGGHRLHRGVSSPSVSYDIQFVGKIKSALFGGEGLFFATLRGPGRVWLQSLPFSRMADRIVAAAPQTGGKRKGEGSVLGGIGRPARRGWLTRPRDQVVPPHPAPKVRRRSSTFNPPPCRLKADVTPQTLTHLMRLPWRFLLNTPADFAAHQQQLQRAIMDCSR